MTTHADLDRLANLINRTLADPDPESGYFVQYAYGQPRLLKDRGAVDVSPRLPTGQLEQWMRAFHAGIIAGAAVPQAAHPKALQLVQYAVADLTLLGEEEARSRGIQPVGGLTSTIPAFRAAARLEQAIPLLIDPERAVATGLKAV